MFTKLPVRSDGKPRSEKMTSATVLSVLKVVLVLDELGVTVCADGVERGNKVFKKNPVRSDGKLQSENKEFATVGSVLNVVFVLDEHGLRVVAVCVLERGKEVFTKNPVRSNGKPRSEKRASATVGSELNVVLVFDEQGLRVVAVRVLERGNSVFTKNPVRSDGKPRRGIESPRFALVSGNKAVLELKENNVVLSRNNEQHPFLCE